MARGEITKGHLEDIQVSNKIYTYPDIALILPPSRDERILDVFAPYKQQAKTIVGVSPNVVCEGLTSKSKALGRNYVIQLAAMLDIMTARNDYLIVFIPHTHSFRSDDRDDCDLCRDILSEMRHENSIPILDTKHHTPNELKALIGQCDLFIGSRFHALVAAISMGVPSMAIGWHPKYEELMTWVGCQEYVCDCRRMEVAYLRALFERLEQNRSQIAQRLDAIVPILQGLVHESIDLIAEYIRRCVLSEKSKMLT